MIDTGYENSYQKCTSSMKRQGISWDDVKYIFLTHAQDVYKRQFLERLLIPTGLHHLVYTPFQFSDLGGVLQLGDTTVAGAYAIAMTCLLYTSRCV